jgi:FkbM family methyltransferase
MNAAEFPSMTCAGAPAPATADDEPPFGHFAPTAVQRLLIGLASNTPLGRGGARWFMSSLIERVRGGPVDVERLGLKMRLYHAEHFSEKKMLLHMGQYDADEIAHLSKHIRPGFHFADVGANAGYYALAVKAKCPDARIAAFEPNPVFTRRLAFNLRANGFSDVAVVRAAVGAERGSARFFFENETLLGAGESIEVDVVPLYEALQERGFTRLDGMKIDIEGFEDRVLFRFFETAPQEFRPRVVVIEHGSRHLWERDCLALCASLGYREIWRGKLNAVLVNDA